jgi:CobQ-like glutamine amidotransferase family enzyme
MHPDSAIDIVLVYPDLLGTYGDRGNAAALAHRALAHGLRTRLVEVGIHDPVPAQGDIYLIGGGEDAAMMLAREHLRRDRGLGDALDAGAACFGVCAGFQLLSHAFVGPDGSQHEGLGLLDVRCRRLPRGRAVGEVLADSLEGMDVGFLTGFENHQGDAGLGPGVRPLGRLVRGIGNGDGATEGAVQGSIIATYLHGPALVRNAGLADHLLQLVAGTLTPVVDEPVQRLRHERRSAALTGHRQRTGRLLT